MAVAASLPLSLPYKDSLCGEPRWQTAGVGTWQAHPAVLAQGCHRRRSDLTAEACAWAVSPAMGKAAWSWGAKPWGPLVSEGYVVLLYLGTI